MKKSALILAPAVFALAGCGGPSCDGSKALDAVRGVADTNQSWLKGSVSGKVSGQIPKTADDVNLEKIGQKYIADGQKMNAVLQSCGQKPVEFAIPDYTGPGGAGPSMDRPAFYEGNEGERAAWSREAIDSNFICKDSVGTERRTEADAAFHAANITNLAYQIADDIKLWFEYRKKAAQNNEKMTNEKMKGFKLSLENIIMTDKNKTTGAVMCKATAVGRVGDTAEDRRDITYAIEKNSAGEFVATVWGL